MSGQQVFFNILRPVFTRRGIVLNIARRYASKKKLEASMGGIFEPFLSNTLYALLFMFDIRALMA